MRPYRRRKAYTIVIFLAFAGLIFICFQMLSIQMLNRQVHDDTDDSKEVADNGCLNGNCDKPQNKRKQRQNKDQRTLTKQERESQKRAIAGVIEEMRAKVAAPDTPSPPAGDAQAKVRPVRPKARPVQKEHQRDEEARPRGVPRHWSHLYFADSRGMFSCVDTRVKIPFGRVNDDYCDCEDGSDEPGTSACNNGRFYCEFQVNDDLVWFDSSRVNDGLCDCCDGSDEWDSPPLAHRVAARGRKVGGENDSQPCIDRCDELVKKMEEENKIEIAGKSIKDVFIAKSAGKPNPNHIYGRSGEFTPLSENCYSGHGDKYSYSVCPFKEVRQNTKLIGKAPAEWISREPKNFRLKMGHGDQFQCPGSKKRITWLVFLCGLDNVVKSVQETEICEYTIEFLTPAACSG